MEAQFDWSVLEKVGIGGVAAMIIYFGFQVVKLVLKQWENSTAAQNSSTAALDKNTEAFERLSDVFAKQAEREVEYQERTLRMLKDGATVAAETNRIVHEINRKIQH